MTPIEEAIAAIQSREPGASSSLARSCETVQRVARDVVAEAPGQNTLLFSRITTTTITQPTTRGGARAIHRKMHRARLATYARDDKKFRKCGRALGGFARVGFALSASPRRETYHQMDRRDRSRSSPGRLTKEIRAVFLTSAHQNAGVPRGAAQYLQYGREGLLCWHNYTHKTRLF
jgi:hypothetical protein